ncbi:hypothetical protein DSO57_1003401 [Entomophthora muscae]|uniref:Uncharacterized protein n=1 Tax=Entomophthora muscae TaxID=34485 RepID=A0ACC2TKG5_9FUNG|nr:hypothetical protein DSO57_1003401 [Entomophthora muscae]
MIRCKKFQPWLFKLEMATSSKQPSEKNSLSDASLGKASDFDGYAELRDEEILQPYTISHSLDEMMACKSFGAQVLNYYRYGERRECGLYWDKFKFCLSMSTLKPEDKKKRIIKYEKELKKRQENQKSSLDIWELRTSPPVNFPPSFTNE